jgi:23S rRNA (guanine745-N1)-methyltransferase
MIYQCPLCHHPLSLQQRQWGCANNHQFDIAKEGYVNLLPVQHKHSRQPGDSQEMMVARRAFLDQGYYQPLRNKLVMLLDNVLPESAEALLDIGCGEGYYTSSFASQLTRHTQLQVYGLDVAKIAIRYAAKRYPEVQFCVASSHRLPFADNSLDAVVRIYAPCQGAELKRVVKPGGYLLTVSPAPRHLYQLKEIIYSQVQLHPCLDEHIEGFSCQEQLQLGYDMTLPAQQAVDLLQMTPFAWRASPQTKQQLLAQTHFSCEVDFAIRLYQRQGE